MNTFKVGDRVRVYLGCFDKVGTISSIDGTLVRIRDDVGNLGNYHYKQCRKLKKKEKKKAREWWIKLSAKCHSSGNYSCSNIAWAEPVDEQGFTHVREVLDE